MCCGRAADALIVMIFTRPLRLIHSPHNIPRSELIIARRSKCTSNDSPSVSSFLFHYLL